MAEITAGLVDQQAASEPAVADVATETAQA